MPRLSEFANFCCVGDASARLRGHNAGMARKAARNGPFAAARWKLARSGDFRAARCQAHQALSRQRAGAIEARVDLHLVAAFCSMRQGRHAEALQELQAAALLARRSRRGDRLALRIDAWLAELGYFQGRYSEAEGIVARILQPLRRRGDWAYVGFALRTRIAILLARTDYDAIVGLAEEALAAARKSRDPYVLVQVLNVLGATYFDRATAKLSTPHAHAHLAALDPADTAPMEAGSSAARCACAWGVESFAVARSK